ncbi:MAG: 23S rRNA (pseudouridine(1915)-N(3))-methyltransferase RlmH [Erysipelotrichaceae bacterium]|nr:23S rRNA (pseudouridine(1915)-N(3))-methyltransferase RlmH [Erysipelotrichaceae bacterium]
MIKVVAIGKVKDKHLAALIEDYTKRIGRYHKIEVIEVKDEAIADNEKAVMDKEGERALARIDKDDYVILLDLHGKSIDSLSLANKIDSWFTNHPKICFVIGGSLGLSEKLIERANERMKLSDLTFLHQMTRLILLEQIYRSFKILNHETYHK